MKTKPKKNLPKKGKSNSTSTPQPTRAAELTKLFLQTPEMQECKLTAGGIANKLDPRDTVTVKIKLAKQFGRLAEFLEEKSAAARGTAPMPLEKLMSRILDNYFHEQLHFLVVAPLSLAYYRDLWNSFCDAHGAPEEKIPDPLLGTPQGREEGPF